jgi:hypothetical protein
VLQLRRSQTFRAKFRGTFGQHRHRSQAAPPTNSSIVAYSCKAVCGGTVSRFSNGPPDSIPKRRLGEVALSTSSNDCKACRPLPSWTLAPKSPEHRTSNTRMNACGTSAKPVARLNDVLAGVRARSKHARASSLVGRVVPPVSTC